MRSLQKVSLVKHSAPTKMLSELLMYADSKRFNVPIKKLGKFSGRSCTKLHCGFVSKLNWQQFLVLFQLRNMKS